MRLRINWLDTNYCWHFDYVEIPQGTDLIDPLVHKCLAKYGKKVKKYTVDFDSL